MELTSREEGLKQTNFTNSYLITMMTSTMKEDKLLKKQKGTWANILIWEDFLEDAV